MLGVYVISYIFLLARGVATLTCQNLPLGFDFVQEHNYVLLTIGELVSTSLLCISIIIESFSFFVYSESQFLEMVLWRFVMFLDPSSRAAQEEIS